MERVHANEKTQLMKSFIQQKAESIKWKEKYRIEQKEREREIRDRKSFAGK
jgi:hypothetical protein